MVRDAYLAAATAAVALVGDEAVARRWDEPSVLDGMSVGLLAGHLARSVLQVEWYLDAPLPDGEPITAEAYYARLEGTRDPGSPLDAGVRSRSEEAASAGPVALHDRAAAARDRLADRLRREPPDRRLEAFGRVLLLDEYLRTRCVELAVHLDDLALSACLAPAPPPAAVAVAVDVLVGAARERSGDLAVLRSLARRERDPRDAVRVL
ncbi:MAG: maleylpyruvate isomerase N-terminal domain-containing protein [Acidimicrobiia bacterium]|nr:maleylpyruvate isomerase N-terminal domain-containing protein [Acidimicrobiia bacterium]